MDVEQPAWVSAGIDNDEEFSPVVGNSTDMDTSEEENADFTQRQSSPLAPPSYERTYLHKIYRLYKFITIVTSLLLLIAQVVSVAFLPFDGVELVIKLFLSSFSVLIILNELERWKMLQESPLLSRWIPRGVSKMILFYDIMNIHFGSFSYLHDTIISRTHLFYFNGIVQCYAVFLCSKFNLDHEGDNLCLSYY